uniref:Phycobilisome linker polypeptide n=1 Tax=Symphyocladia marchantioides TaxID=88360 RepID=UPI0022FDAE7A|nr:Phycobilisome linker polypeptide [Symphyocladia marchantioides]WAX03880.1 Phycobilisome linker polypeptide [Symphyocladia marchantioides]
MIVKASCGSPLVQPKMYRTVALSSILQAEQQDRFLQLGELSQLVYFFSSGSKRLEVAKLLTINANSLVSRAADKIFVGGSPISYLERPQASFLDIDSNNPVFVSQALTGNSSNNLFDNISSVLFDASDPLPPGFKPINVIQYGSERMKKSLRDLDWFLRYLTYAIISGDPNILSVNIRGLRELIDNACSSAAAIVALREMRKLSINLFEDDLESKQLVKQYFDVLIVEFESSGLSDKVRKRVSIDMQGLRLPRIYNQAGVPNQRFVIKSSLSNDEKKLVIRACYRQVFERDISKAYGLQFSDLESQVKIGKLSIKEFIRFLGKSFVYKQQFNQPFVNSRVIELSCRHFLGRGLSSIEEFQKYFAIVSNKGLNALVDNFINSQEYADYFGEETVPYLRNLGEEAQESRNWGPQIRLFNYSTVFRKIPDFITLFADYKSKLSNQHAYGLSNDPLSLQFGAIFPKSTVALKTKSSFFTRDTRRLLVRYGPGIYNQISSPSLRNKNIKVIGPIIFSKKDSSFTIQQIISAVYLRVFGRFVYTEELFSILKYENQFKNSLISVKEFIGLLVKSSVFRFLYWDKLYICKAIEYIHIKLIGRPTYSRQEIDQYFNIVYKKGYYSMIDSMLNSLEYIESFGDFIVPYERYLTSSSISSRGLSFSNSFASSVSKLSKVNFISLSKLKEERSLNSMDLRIKQGVTNQRYQFKLFVLNKSSNALDKVQILRAVYRQIFERDLGTFSIGDQFYSLEKSFMNSEITVKKLVQYLGSSDLYRKEFYQPYPNTKVIELSTKHFLGRAPNNQSEIRYYNQILASQGLYSLVSTIVHSIEYEKVFGSNVVPYRRFPTLPAANFPNTEKLYNNFTKQDISIVISVFPSTSSC